MSERDLVERAKRGDLDAYELLLRESQAQANRTAYLILRQKEEAEDAIQEAFVRAWDRLDTFDANRRFRPWLIMIVANEARDRLRRRHHLERLQLRAAADSARQSSHPAPERDVVVREQMQDLLDTMARMDPTDQQILTYRYFLDLPTNEIADLINLPHGTVRSRISRARQRLRETLTELHNASADGESS